jgi:zona occludens toxin
VITLLTGLPGNGKTLFALWYIKTKADRERREVFYHNVKDLDTAKVGNWMPCDPKRWMDLPHGSIILIDECQEIFPKIPNGAKPPEHYEELAKHRHKGFDIYLITQHPTLIDNFARRLVGQHFHSVRKFGLQRATIYEWSSCSPSPETPSSQKSAVSLKWKYPPEVFTWYKSAEVHTVKRAIPMKLVLAVLFVVAVPAIGYYALDRFQQRGKVAPDQIAAQPAVAGVAGPSGASYGGSKPFDPVEDARNYVAMNTPRIEGLPQTAPKYDPLTVPVRVPVPAACIQVGLASSGKVSCKCYTQQGTPMAVEFNMCVEFARNGYFQDFDAERDRQQDERTQRGAAVLADKVDQPMRIDHSPSRVLAFADVPASPMTGANPPPNLNDGPPSGRPSRTVVRE